MFWKSKDKGDGPSPKTLRQPLSPKPPNAADAPAVAEATEVWVPDKERVWVRGRVTRQVGRSELEVETEDGVTVAVDLARHDTLHTANPSAEQDMCSLWHMSEPAVLSNLQLRFAADQPYTYVAHLLIAVNPLKPIPDPAEARTATPRLLPPAATLTPRRRVLSTRCHLSAPPARNGAARPSPADLAGVVRGRRLFRRSRRAPAAPVRRRRARVPRPARAARRGRGRGRAAGPVDCRLGRVWGGQDGVGEEAPPVHHLARRVRRRRDETRLEIRRRTNAPVTVLETSKPLRDFDPERAFLYLVDARGLVFTNAFGLTESVKAKGVGLGEEFSVTVCTPDGAITPKSIKFIDPNRLTTPYVVCWSEGCFAANPHRLTTP